MKRFALCFALALTVATVVLSQLNCAAPSVDNNNKVVTATNTNATSAPTTNAPTTNAAVEKELTQLEQDWANTIKTRDLDTMKRIEAEDITFVYPDATLGDRAHDINDIQSGALTADAWTLSDMKVRVFDPDAAVVTGVSMIKNGKYKNANGKVDDISGEYRWTDTWIKRNGQWQVVASQSTKMAKQ